MWNLFVISAVVRAEMNTLTLGLQKRCAALRPSLRLIRNTTYE